MQLKWKIEEKDIQLVKEIIYSQKDKDFVKKRFERNIKDPAPIFNKNIFWKTIVDCLLTTQQRSGPKSFVTKFITLNPFPLSLNKCKEQANLQHFVEKTIGDFGGLRFKNKLAMEISDDFIWLELHDGWFMIKNIFDDLLKNRKSPPHKSHIETERKSANLIVKEKQMKGFGPKQSRNLLQELGLTRFEIPIDSRITDWLNKNNILPIKLSSTGLSDHHYYDFVMGGVQELCQFSKIYPCILDAAIFSVKEN